MNIFSPVQNIQHPLFNRFKLTVKIKRDDLLHAIISGNKWRKLKYNLILARQLNKVQIVSFGGSYSNHIHALAFACQQQGLASVGIIRGESEYANNATLRWARHWGMTLNFVDRQTYRQRQQPEFLAQLQQQYPDALIVPEGGSNQLALAGVGEIMAELAQQTTFDSLLVPVGSGGTIAGLILADENQHNIIGIAVLKQADYLPTEVRALLPASAQSFAQWQIMSNFHRGGYAKFSAEDCQRILAFSQQTGIPFEPIYSGKMLLALLDMIEAGYFPAGHTIMLLHTGGLQGLAGLVEQQRINGSHWPVPSAPPVQ